MKCMYFEKECCSKKHCPECMVDEINYYRKKLADMEPKNNVKKGSIQITKDELITAQAEAFTYMALKNPAMLFIKDEFSEAAGLTVSLLFNKEEK